MNSTDPRKISTMILTLIFDFINTQTELEKFLKELLRYQQN